MLAIDKTSFVPIYLQISEDLKSQILSGKYQNGDRLPSENELVEQYKVTRTTIQRSLSELSNEGIIERIHGKGTYVRLRKVRENIWNFSGFSAYAKKTNQRPITKVIKHEIITKKQRNYLKLIRLRGFQKQDKQEWMTLDTSILNLEMFPALDKYDFSELSLYDTLEKNFNTKPNYASLHVKAIDANEKLMNYFKMTSSFPLLNVQGTVFDQHGRAIEKVNVIYSDHADFNVVINI